MPTERGWASLGASLAFVVLWFGFGELELLAAGLFLGGAALLAWAAVRIGSPQVEVGRRLSPPMVHDGETSVVTLSLSGRGRLWHLTLEDEVAGLGTARFVSGRVPAGETWTASYQILARPRGVYQVGPARVVVADPLHLAQLTTVSGESDRLVVYPAVDRLDGFPLVRGLNPALHAARPEFSHRGGEDFFTLRDYQQGDDLRRVHWPSSAKRDDLMIRQLETPWQSRALVLLDVRRNSYENGAAFEKAVSGAASAVLHLQRNRFDCDLWAGTTGVRRSDLDAAAKSMRLLAAVDWVDSLDLRGLAGRIRSDGAGGALVLVTGVADGDLAAVQQLLSRDFGTTVVMSVTSTSATRTVQLQRAGAVTVVIAPGESWTDAWRVSMEATWSTVSAG